MRYDKAIFFVKETGGAYDPTTGDYAASTLNKCKVYASVMDTSADTLRLVYGGIVQGSLTIQIQNRYSGEFDYIEYNGKRYNVDRRRKLRVKETFIVSEIQ